MAQRFELFRLSLIAPGQVDLFAPDPYPSREDYLRKVFGRDYSFEHYGTTLHYAHEPQDVQPGYLFGRIGREVVTIENLPPEQRFAETDHVGWRASLIVLDPANTPDGQKISFEVNDKVGRPLALLTSLVKEINKPSAYGYYKIEVEPIFDSDSFWDFANENAGAVTSLTFEFVAPNGLWSSASNLKDELKSLNAETRALDVVVTMKNEDGLQTDAQTIREGVRYVQNGSGKIRARAKGGKIFNSTGKTKTATLQSDPLEEEPILGRALRHLAKILGRE